MGVNSYMTQDSSTKGDLFKSGEKETVTCLLPPIKVSCNTHSVSLFCSPFFGWGSLCLLLHLQVKERDHSSPYLTSFSLHVSNHVSVVFVFIISNSPVRAFQAINWFLTSICQSQVVIKTGPGRRRLLVEIVGGLIPNNGLCISSHFQMCPPQFFKYKNGIIPVVTIFFPLNILPTYSPVYKYYCTLSVFVTDTRLRRESAHWESQAKTSWGMQDGTAWLPNSERSSCRDSSFCGLIQWGFPSFPHDKNHVTHLLKIDIPIWDPPTRTLQGRVWWFYHQGSLESTNLKGVWEGLVGDSF